MFALFLIHLAEKVLALFGHLFDQGTGLPGNNDKEFIRFIPFLDGSLHLCKVIGIHGYHILGIYARRKNDLFDIDDRGRLPHQGLSGAGVFLMAGHRGRAVIQDTNRHAAFVPGRVD
ncbi:hypothetical protein SDC9_203731 [bioreactor metagenome]|uniref:Uncharacterized protein n=1 Tax=bioreactor metagenome TaxID=1076179 RepID=A0A645IX90_9ZZZZ